jgi:hypothetical protein
MSEEEKAKVVIQKAKVEDDEYKNYTEEQTYYRCVNIKKNVLFCMRFQVLTAVSLKVIDCLMR